MAEGGAVQSVLSVGALTSELVTVSASWRALGLKLGVEEWQLNNVDSDRSTVTDKLAATLDQWLRKKTDASWADVAHALEEMREFALAMKIKANYLAIGTNTSVTNCNPDPQALEQSEEATALAQENRTMMEERFARLQTFVCEKIQKRLEAKEISPDQVLLYITNLFPPGDRIPQTSNLFSVFTAITRNCLWDFWHYQKLARIAKMYIGEEDPALTARMDQYTQHLGGYKLATKMVQHMSTVASKSADDELLSPTSPPARKDQPYLRKLTLKLKIRITEQSLLYIDELWDSVAQLFLIPPSTAILDKILEGSLYITWLIPCHQIPQIMERVKLPEVAAFFCENRIEAVAIEGVHIFTAMLQEEDSLSPVKMKELDDNDDDDTEAKPQTQPMAVQVTGHDVELVKESPELMCPICLLLLRDPMQVSCCGKRFCAACINRSLAENWQCPHCKAESSNVEVFEDKAQRQAILEVEVYCSNRDDGCQWSGELCQLEHHLNIDSKKGKEDQGCDYTKVMCVHCSKYLPRFHVHHCSQRPYTCSYCGQYQSTYDDVVNKHWHSCEGFPIQCRECSRKIARMGYQKHVRECAAIRDPLQRPLQLDTKTLEIAVAILQPISAKAYSLAVKLIPSKTSYDASLLGVLREWLAQEDPPPTWEALAQALEELGELPLAAKVRSQQSQDMCIPMTLRAKASVPVYYTPPPEFTLHHYSHYMRPGLHEEFPFYSQHGYKMILVVYPYGLGEYQGTHVSVGVHIVKGKYDTNLHWPLSAEVTIKLINQWRFSPHTGTKLPFHNVTEGESHGAEIYTYNFIRHDELTNYLNKVYDCLIFRIANIEEYFR